MLCDYYLVISVRKYFGKVFLESLFFLCGILGLANEIVLIEMEEFSFEKRHEQFVYVLNSKILNQLEYYTYLHKSNSQDLKETIRFISEELVWSDQNQRSFFE